MRNLLTRLWSDQVGSTMSAEMAMVTSVTVGALFMGMGKFSQTVNEEFQNSARLAGLDGTVLDASVDENEDSTETDSGTSKRSGWRFRRAGDGSLKNGRPTEQSPNR